MNASDYNLYVRNQAGHSTGWRRRGGINNLRNLIKRKIFAILNSRSLTSDAIQKLPSITSIVEKELFLHAASEDEYKNQDTLVQRLLKHLQGTRFCPQVNSYNTSTPMKGPSSGLSQSWCNRNQADPTLQMFAASNINFTDYSKATANNTNNYEFSNGRQSHASVGNERTFPSNGLSSVQRCVGPNGFSNYNASGGTSNLNSSSKPIFSHLQQHHRDHVDMDWISTVTTPREYQLSLWGNMMIPPSVRTEASQAFNNFTAQNSCYQYSTVNNLMQYQPQNLDSQQNFQHFNQSYDNSANAYIAKSRPCFRSKDEHCCQLQGQKTLNQSQLPSTLMNVGQQFSSASSAHLYGSNGASWVALRNFDKCSSDACHSLESADNMMVDSTVRDHGNLENILRPAKRLKIEPTFDVSLSNNEIFERSPMVLTNSPEGLPELPQQPESSFPIYSEVTENNMESSANAKQDSASLSEIDDNVNGIEAILFEFREAHRKLRDSYPKSNDEVARNFGENGSSDACHSLESADNMTVDSTVRDHGNLEDILRPAKRLKIEPTFDVSVSNNEIFERSPMVLTDSPEGLPELPQQPESSFPIYSEVTENNMESSANAKQDSASLSEIDDNVNGIEAVLFEFREAHRKLRDSYPKSNDEVARNFGENGSGSNSNSSIHTFQKDPSVDTDSVQERGGFDQVGKKNTQEVIEPKADLKKATESSNIKIMTVSDGIFGHNFDNETISQAPVVDGVLEESCLESNGLIARNSRDSVYRSNFSIQTFQNDPFGDIGEEQDKNVIDLTGKSITDEVIESKYDLEQGTVSLKTNPMESGVSYDVHDKTYKSGTLSEGIEAGNTLEDSYVNSYDVKLRVSNLQYDIGSSNSSDHSLQKGPISDIDGFQSRNEFNHSVEDNTKEVTEPKFKLENGEKSSKPTLSGVSLTETFTYDQLREHIMSLRQGFGQSTLEEEIGIGENTCTLCGMDNLFFEPVPIYCLACGNRIRRNANFYCRRAEENDTEQCFCTTCFKNSQGESIQFDGAYFPKKIFDCRKTDSVTEEETWAQCDKCKRWQHQICALFNGKRNTEGEFPYVCPKCRSKEIEEGNSKPLGTAIFGAKDLPRTKLSDHIEQRLFSRLEHERAHKAKVEGKNVDEISGAENLTVRVVQSVEKQLKVKKEFLDILSGETYPPEFPYTSKVILLFQNIEGVDVCIYVIFVQEFGSECDHPNHRSVYISYLDSVKYFRPERETVTGEALRTFVYHEILIGYLEFCKKRGFEKCYIWACPPPKGEDYVLYCHPQSQKTPKNDKLRHWYHSVLRKATAENIVVGLTNVYDQFFVTAQRRDSYKVTAARLPYFDGDYWSGAAMDEIEKIEQESKAESGKKLKQVLTKRALKSMGHTNPSKDVLVMQNLGQTILPVKEDFIIIQLQYACTLCREVILSGKRWFCTECKKYQQCERCHTSDTHTSIGGEKHTLCQVVVDDIPSDTKENDIVLGNDLFQNRVDFVNFFQQNLLQFDTLRRAKHSSMMLLYHLKSSASHNMDSRCRICRKDNVSQLSLQCDFCPQLSICSECYEEKGANCHEHELRQCSSTSHCLSENQGLEQKTTVVVEFESTRLFKGLDYFYQRQKLLKALRHASQCNSTISQPCSYPDCLLIKKLFSHASKCTVKARGGCQHCKKAWTVLSLHSKNCKGSECCIPRCNDMKNYAEWLAQQHESQRRVAVLGSAKRNSNGGRCWSQLTTNVYIK